MGRKLPPQFEVEIIGLSRIGEGTGFYGLKKVCVFGALPGEKILVRPLKKSRRGVKAAVLEILVKSPDRREAREDHFLSCSPWQIVDEKIQLEWKKKISKQMFMQEAGELLQKNVGIVAGSENWNYRNKMEFSFRADATGLPVLAFHQRFRYWDYVPLTGCVLAQEKINVLAEKIIKELHKREVKNQDLKNLIIRYSAKENKCIAALYVVNPDFPKFDIVNDDMVGWQIIYSDPKSPITINTDCLFKSGRDYLEERVNGLDLKFYFDGFFQVNIKVFEKLLDFVKNETKGGRILSDLYSGVGTIGFALAHLFERVNSIEFDSRAVEMAKQNAQKNNLSNIVFFAGAAEKHDLDECLKNTDTLVVDPPRSGMHPKVIRKILETGPKNFIYVSCNPHTQAQNYRELKKAYKVVNWQLFDMYPQTPHIESVLILKRKNYLEKMFAFLV